MAEHTEPENEQVSDQANSELDDNEDPIRRESPSGPSQIQVARFSTYIIQTHPTHWHAHTHK